MLQARSWARGPRKLMRELPEATKAESVGEVAPAQSALAQFLSGPPHPWGAIEVRTDTELHLVPSSSGPTLARRCTLALRDTAQQTPSLCGSNWRATKSERALLGENPNTYAASGETEDLRLGVRLGT